MTSPERGHDQLQPTGAATRARRNARPTVRRRTVPPPVESASEQADVRKIDNVRDSVARRQDVVNFAYREVLYRVFRGTPVSRATTVDATPRGAPAATSSITEARAAAASGPRVEGPMTSVTSPRGASPKRSASAAAEPRTTSSNFFVSSRHTATSRSGSTAARLASEAGRRLADSNATVGWGQAPSSSQRAARSRSLRGKVSDESVLLSREAARDERRLDGRWARKHRHRDTGRERSLDDPRPRIVDAREPGIGDKRHPLPGDEPRHQVGNAARFVVLMVRQEPGPDPVTLEKNARVPCVLAEHRLSGTQLVEDAQRHVCEVPDRRCAHGERHAHLTPSSASKPTSAAPIRPASSPSSAWTIRRVSSAGWITSPRAARSAGSRMRSPAAAPKPPPMMTTSGSKMFDERPDRDPEQPADLGECFAVQARRRPSLARRAVGHRRPARTAQPRRDRPRARRRLPRDGRARGSSPDTAPSRDHHDVPELGPATVEPVVDHETAADSRAEREHDQVGRTAARSEPPLGERCRVTVVLDPRGQRIALAGAIRKVDVVERGG